MRVSIVNLNLLGHDATGQSILHQARFFLRRGDDVRIYTHHPPEKVPESIRALVQVATPAELLADRASHFMASDLYVYHYPCRYDLLESIRSLERGAVLFYYHNVTPPELWESDFGQEWLQESVESVGRFTPYADLMVADSQFNAQQLVEQYGVDPARVRVLPLPVSLERFRPGPKDPGLLERYGLLGKRVILFVGRMASNKRVDLLVEALPRIQEEFPNAMLLLVGDDRGNPAIQENVQRVKARAEALGVDDAVIFAGVVDELPEHYRLADVYATASLHEGFGVPLLEAMASGVPVVASRATAHPWVVGEAGVLVDPGDAQALAKGILEVLADDSRAGELIRRGLARAQEFSVEAYERNWFRVVAEVTAWLPNNPYPVLVEEASTELELSQAQEPSTEDQPAQDPRPKRTTPPAALAAEMDELLQKADVMLRGYTVRSKLPVLGPLIAWVRRNLTSHLREPYVDPTFERQVAFNQQLVRALQRLAERQEAMEARLARLAQGDADPQQGGEAPVPEQAAPPAPDESRT